MSQATADQPDSAGGATLTSNGGVGSGSFAQWQDALGNGNLAMSVLSQYRPAQQTVGDLLSVVTAPTILASVLPSGLAAWSFEPGNATVTCFKCGKLGLTVNPPNWTVYAVCMLVSIADEVDFFGNDAAILPDASVTPSCCFFVDVNDLNETRGFTTAFGDGTDRTAASTQNNLWSANVAFCLTLSYTAGDDHVRLWVNRTEATYTKFQSGNWATVTSCGGTMFGYRLGQGGEYDGSHDAPPGNFHGRQSLHFVANASHGATDRGKMWDWISGWSGLGF